MSASAGSSNHRAEEQANLRKRASIKQVVFIAGVSLWLGILLLHTGVAAVLSIWHIALLLVEMLALTMMTRTLPVMSVISLLMFGSGTFGVAWLLGKAYVMMEGTSPGPGHYLFIPMIEELCKFLLLLYIVWRGRKLRTWTYGISDLLLMGVALGAGFELIEDAFIMHNHNAHAAGFSHQSFLSVLPTVVKEGGRHIRYIAGHALWTGIAGASLGAGLMFHNRKLMLVMLPVAGLSWAVFDHIRSNYTNHYSNVTAGMLQSISAGGILSIVLFILALISAVWIDTIISRRTLPKRTELEIRLSAGGSWRYMWEREINRRELAYFVFRVRRAAEPWHSAMIEKIGQVGFGFFMEHFRKEQAVLPNREIRENDG